MNKQTITSKGIEIKFKNTNGRIIYIIDCFSIITPHINTKNLNTRGISIIEVNTLILLGDDFKFLLNSNKINIIINNNRHK